MKRSTTLFPLFALGVLAFSCKSRTNTETKSVATAAQLDSVAPYETVNGTPQLSVDGNQFSFYWGLWRGLSAAELQQITTLPGQQASLVSRRAVVWNLHDCESGAMLHRNHEEFYFLDELQLDAGTLRPIREAVRPGWRYFSMGSFNSLLAREDWGVPEVVQRQGESNREFSERHELARQAWLAGQTRRGQRGQVMLQSEHKFFAVAPSSIRSSFVSFFDYRTDDLNQLGGAFAAFNPSRWPVYYDERAHKPHSIEAPEIWRANEKTITGRLFNVRLNWNWCNGAEKPVAEFEAGADDLPPPGPNRPGRTDSGNTPLPVKNRS